ncbi:MAG: DEAD/DEAH box helicase [Verrucomicrobiae bacterium]|nr:DEAD/DEAH box helicase [Verrucomicrobiae bacterium]NNJ85948.1 hypothetical protein [Akkermansiaceae bacterium]
MEITERWVGQAAGGRVFKGARALVKLGKVTKLVSKDTEDAAVFQGMVGSGCKPMRVVVKVMGPTRVKNLCGCAMARSTGAMCEHAAALLLASIEGSHQPVKTEKTHPVESTPSMRFGQSTRQRAIPFEVRLSPRFPEQGVRAVHLRRVTDALIQEADQVLTDWLVEHTGRAEAAMLSLPENQLAGFYHVLAGHPRVSVGDELVSIRCGELRPPVALELEGEMMWIKLAMDGGGTELVSLGGCLAEWDADANKLTISDTVATEAKSSGWIDMEDLLSGDWYQIPAADFVKSLDGLLQSFQCPDDLGGLMVREAIPEIKLELAGSTRALQAKLVAGYSETVTVPLAQAQSVDVAFPIPSPTPGEWLVRHAEYEQQVVGNMMELGFQILDAYGSMFLRGEDEVLEFLTADLPALRKKWTVKCEQKLVQVESMLGRIVPQIELEGSGTDWLACDVHWQVGGKSLDRDAVRRLLQSGSRTLPLPRGGKAVISRFDAEVMEGFLLDTDPRQEDGRYYFPAQQRDYIAQLRSHYGDKDDRLTCQVPQLPDDLEQTLRGYQKEGVAWMYQKISSDGNHGGVLLADDMGLGKTLQTLVWIKLWKNHRPKSVVGPALVVCPATLLGNWRDEARKFVPDLHVLVMHGSRRKDYFEVMAAADIILTSYALIDRDCEQYQQAELGAIILDEASAIRNPDTLAAKAVRKVSSASAGAARLAITGTPVENSVRDLWSIFQFLRPGYLGGREDFRRRYELPCAAEVPDRAAMQRLRWRTSPFMLRRTKLVVAKDLPPKIESVAWCDPSPLQKEQYQSILRHGAEKVGQLRQQAGKEGARMQMLTVLLRLRQTCCDLRLLDDAFAKSAMPDVSCKLARLMELLDEAQRGGHRVLVFSQFTSMLALIRVELDRAGLEFCYLDGATRDRSGEVDRFQKPSGPPVFLISLKAGGYGLTLTAADTVVLFDPWWNPAVEAQAADRIHRIGQTKPATIYKLITRGTVEEKILRLQERKRNVISAAMGEQVDEVRPLMSGLSESEMLELLE